MPPVWVISWPSILAAGEAVLDVPPKLAAKARLLWDGDTNKNEHNDARSVAVAGLRSTKVRPAVREDYSAVMGMWSDRYLELAAARTQVVCRLNALVCELVPGGFPGVLRANAAQKMLEGIDPASSADPHAWPWPGSCWGPDPYRRAAPGHQKAHGLAVTALGTTVTQVCGVGAFVACAVIGHVVDINRFASRAAFAAYNGTAPVEVSSGEKKIYRLSRRGNRRLNHAIHMAAIIPDPLRRHPGPDLLRTQTRRGQRGQGSHPGAQAADQRPHLRPPGRRRQSRGHPQERSGRANRERL
jgi:hypothetical protein